MLTRLNVINSMLAATGTLPVTADDDTHPAYIKANAKLTEVITAVQKLQLWFNTRITTYEPNVDDEIVLPSNTLNADPTDKNNNFVKRGTRLFDLDENQYTFDSEVELRLTQERDWDEIPETCIHYIKDKARYEFYLDEDGTEPKLSRYDKLQQQSWVELYREHLRNRDTNYFDGPNAARFMKRGHGRVRRNAPYE